MYRQIPNAIRMVNAADTKIEVTIAMVLSILEDSVGVSSVFIVKLERLGGVNAIPVLSVQYISRADNQ